VDADERVCFDCVALGADGFKPVSEMEIPDRMISSWAARVANMRPYK
jgi:hypothetical protein